jgi:uncharacterized protein (TIGR03086 family)
MSLDLPVVHHQALQATGRIVAGVRPDQWERPTPCPDWTAHQLLNHIVAGNWWVKPLVGGQTIAAVGDRLDGDVLGHSPLLAYEASAAEADTAFCGDGALEASCAVSYGPVPGSAYCCHRIVDVAIHGWDLAVATGQDTRIDEDLVAAMWEIVEPQREEMEASGAFGTPVDVPAGADLQTRLLAAMGRVA